MKMKMKLKMKPKAAAAVVMSDLLPEDIQVEIFLKLPVNSILSCKCVCKPWHNLLSSSEFVKNHLNRSIQTNKYNLLVNCHASYYVERYTSGFASISLTSLDFLPDNGYLSQDYPFYDFKDNVKILGSSNGLICLRIIGILKYNKRIICIWNPSTREYKKILGTNYGSKSFKNAMYGFGYDDANDDYKLVKINEVKINETEVSNYSNIQVYTLGSDSWNNVQKLPYWFPATCKCNGLLFKGALHWFSVVQESSVEVIMSFNLSNERIVKIPLPEAPLPNYGGVGANVGLLEDCLCLVYTGDDWETVDVWVMKDYGAIESWTKQFTIIQYIPRACNWCPVLAFKNGDILANDLQESVVYNPKGVGGRRKVNITWRTCNGGRPYSSLLESATYVESLVSLNTGTYTGKKILKTPATSGKKTEKGKRSPGFMKKLMTMICYS